MTRIDKKFQELKAANRKAFIPYITAGDPDLKTSADLILALDRAGADIIEVGVPFSDPIADGPVIQRATERALASHTTLRDILQLGVRGPEDLRSSDADHELLQPAPALWPRKAGARRGGFRL